MDIERFYQDYSIRRGYEGEKHFRKGWVNAPCPFCVGNPGNHLGFNLAKNYFKCWRCGHKSHEKVIIKLLGIDYRAAKKIVRSYQGKSYTKPAEIKVTKLKFKFPADMAPIIKNPAAMAYMRKERGFTKQDIHWLFKRYQLQATGDIGFFEYQEKEMDLSYRIIAPILYDGEVVSWQSRDITDTAFLPYITCPAVVETKEHKTVLYNAPDPSKFKIIILCEGIMDVWKVALAGFPATCCFGVEYTYEQLKLLLRYDKVLIFFDPDPAGKVHAKTLIKQMIFAGKDAEIIKHSYNKDPGDMNKLRIRKILKPLMISSNYGKY